MSTIFQRIQRAATAFNKEPINFKEAEERIDAMIMAKQLGTGEESKETKPSSQLDIRDNENMLAYYSTYGVLRDFVSRLAASEKKWYTKSFPQGPDRDYLLDAMWHQEPILAGAVYSMVAKMTSLRWNITGKKRNALAAAKMLSRAAYMGGWDWGGFISSSAQDFYTLNRGVFWEAARGGDALYAPMVDIGHIDALNCTLTGSHKYPITYSSAMTGQTLNFRPGEVIHFTSLPSPREHLIGSGFCAVDRALRAVKLLMGLHDYDDEKLDNLPPEGLAAISGMSKEEFMDAVVLWKAKRLQDNSLTFPQVLWLLSTNPQLPITVDFKSFSSLPESFDRKTVVEQYVGTLALAFGTDAKEFWTFTGGMGGNAGETEIQHMKAKGKGAGEFITTVERHINGELPEDADFKFDTQDIEEDANAAAIAKAWVDAFMPLYNLQPAGQGGAGGGGFEQKAKGNPVPEKPNGAPKLPTPKVQGVDTGGAMGTNEGGQSKQAEQVINRDDFIRLLIDRGVLPDWMGNDNRTMITDTEIHNQVFREAERAGDEVICLEWERGILKQKRVPGMIILNSPKVEPDKYPEALQKDISAMSYIQAWEHLMHLKEEVLEATRGIRGEPIPESEAVRGSVPTRKTIHDELERWRNHPILAAYALSVEQEEAMYGKVS